MMDYHELIDALTCEDKNALDYIYDAVEMLEHLYSELKAANARCETLSKMVAQYQDDIIPGYRERAEKAERERRAVLERLGEFGQLFIDYVGCPRGAMGRQCAPLTEELLSMPVITDVDGGRWRPVNEDALQEAIALLKERQG